MVAVKAGEVERVLRSGRSPASVILLYGPDTGLVAERARAAAEAAVDDPGDPFQLVRLDGDAVAADPNRLPDEAGTVGLFGGRRCLWVKPTARNIAGPVQVCLEAQPPDTTIVIEAGDLSKSSPLRSLCERAPNALALPCYADTARDLGAIADTVLREAGLTLDQDARLLLLDSLGADRLASRSEVTKLALYAQGRGRVEITDVEAVISDVSALAMDDAVDAAFAGQTGAAEEAVRRLERAGVAAGTLLAAALRHALALLAAVIDVEKGKPRSAVVAAWPRLHFKRKPVVETQLGLWSASRLSLVTDSLQGALLQSRRSAGLASPIAARALLEIALRARRTSSG